MAILIRSASESACIFRMTCPRWICSVISEMPTERGGLLVQESTNNQRQDFSLPGGQQPIMGFEQLDLRASLSCATVCRQCRDHGL